MSNVRDFGLGSPVSVVSQYGNIEKQALERRFEQKLFERQAGQGSYILFMDHL